MEGEGKVEGLPDGLVKDAAGVLAGLWSLSPGNCDGIQNHTSDPKRCFGNTGVWIDSDALNKEGTRLVRVVIGEWEIYSLVIVL